MAAFVSFEYNPQVRLPKLLYSLRLRSQRRQQKFPYRLLSSDVRRTLDDSAEIYEGYRKDVGRYDELRAKLVKCENEMSPDRNWGRFQVCHQMRLALPSWHDNLASSCCVTRGEAPDGARCPTCFNALVM